MIVTVLVLLLVFAGAFFGFRSYASTVAYLANENGKVVVYRGIPGTLFGMQFNELDHTTDVSVSDLQPGVANRLDDGIRVDNVDAANALIDEYKAEIEAKSATPSESDTDSKTDAGSGSSKTGSSTGSSSAGAANGTANDTAKSDDDANGSAAGR